MDLQDWELLDGIVGDGDRDCEGFLQVNYQGRGRGDEDEATSNIYYSRCHKINHPHHDYCSITSTAAATTATLVHTNYFICPPSPSAPAPHQFLHKSTRHLLPLPVHLESPATATTTLDCPHITTTTSPYQENYLKSLATHTNTNTNTNPDPVSQVFFKIKMMETDQFVDMNTIKVESSPTRSNASAAAAGNTSSGAPIIVAEEEGVYLGDPIPNPKVRVLEYRRNIGSVEGEGRGLSKLNIFKWSLSGMAAVAATVCIVVLSSRDRKRGHPHGPLNQIKFRFQICANYDHKHGRMRMRRTRMKQQGHGEEEGPGRVQQHHQSLSGVGVGASVAGDDPLASSFTMFRCAPARITSGGHYCDAA